MRSDGLCAPFTTALTETPIRLQFSCASLDSVVNYFVSHTNNALVPFLLDEDYEKVLGRCGLGKLRGGAVRARGPPRGQCPAAALPLGPLSVLGHVEADKENGESVWVASSTPAAPSPGDASPCGGGWARLRDVGPSWHRLCPILYPELQRPRNYRDHALWVAELDSSQPREVEPVAGGRSA